MPDEFLKRVKFAGRAFHFKIIWDKLGSPKELGFTHC